MVNVSEAMGLIQQIAPWGALRPQHVSLTLSGAPPSPPLPPSASLHNTLPQVGRQWMSRKQSIIYRHWERQFLSFSRSFCPSLSLSYCLSLQHSPAPPLTLSVPPPPFFPTALLFFACTCCFNQCFLRQAALQVFFSGTFEDGRLGRTASSSPPLI